MLYLLFSAGLKITTPALFDLVPITMNTTIQVRATLPATDFANLDADLMNRAIGVAPLLNQANGFPAIGLDGNVLYGSLDANEGAGVAEVESRRVNVRCTYPDTATISSIDAWPILCRGGGGCYDTHAVGRCLTHISSSSNL